MLKSVIQRLSMLKIWPKILLSITRKSALYCVKLWPPEGTVTFLEKIQNMIAAVFAQKNCNLKMANIF